MVLLFVCCGKKTAPVSIVDDYKLSDSPRESFVFVEDNRRDVIKDAVTAWLGVPYRYGGESRDGVDCSGLVMVVFRDALDYKLPRVAREQQSFCRLIDVNNVEIADLLFFTSKSSEGGISHVGISIGGRKFIHSSTSRGVIVSSLDELYYRNHFHSACRVPIFCDSVMVIQSGEPEGPEKEKTAPRNDIREAVRKAMSE